MFSCDPADKELHICCETETSPKLPNSEFSSKNLTSSWSCSPRSLHSVDCIYCIRQKDRQHLSSYPPTWFKFPPDFPNLDPFPVEHPISQPPSVPSQSPAAPNSAATLRRPSTRRPRLEVMARGNWSCGGTR